MIGRTFIFIVCVALLQRPAGAGTLTPLYSPKGSTDGAAPSGALIELGAALYGVSTYGGAFNAGAIYTVDPATAIETVVYSFTGGDDGLNPTGALTAIGGVLYGVTVYGGTAQSGTVFQFDPGTGAETVLHSFAGGKKDAAFPNNGMLNEGGILYGTSTAGGTLGQGTVFAINPATGLASLVSSFGGDAFSPPDSALVDVNGMIAGTARSANSDYSGNIYLIDPETQSKKTLVRFPENGQNQTGETGPATLLYSGGVLYGTTLYGGTNGYGSLYKVDLKSRKLATIYSFEGGADGYLPYGAPILFGGLLYGTTGAGGTGGGTIYAIDPATDTETAVLPLPGPAAPCVAGATVSGLLVLNNTFYGSNACDGATGQGIVFTADPSSGAVTPLHVFTGQGMYDGSGIAFASVNSLARQQGNLVLTSALGGAYSLGDVVSIDTRTGEGKEIYAFQQHSVGARPAAPIISRGNTLFGTTIAGGANNTGMVFRLAGATNAFKALYDFGPVMLGATADGNNPAAAMTLAGGTLYGTTVFGGTGGIFNSSGTVFAINPSGGGESAAFDLPDTIAQLAETNVISVNGLLIGAGATGGSPYKEGAVFSLDPAAGSFTPLYSFQGGADGANPRGTLLQAGGIVYGETASGGSSSDGTIFALDLATGAKTTLYNFSGGAIGLSPAGTLLKYANSIYGSTNAGGLNNAGTIFRLDLATGQASVIYNINSNGEGTGITSLVNIGATLYGATSSGGANGLGTVFRLTP